MAAGLVYVALAALVRWRGLGIVQRVLPPVVTGPVIMVIGLALAPVAIGMATGTAVGAYSGQSIAVALVSLVATVLTSVFGRGLLKLVPILVGVVVGYAFAALLGMVDLTPIARRPGSPRRPSCCPSSRCPRSCSSCPVAIAPAIEHVGDLVAIRASPARTT
jgi:uracil permease